MIECLIGIWTDTNDCVRFQNLKKKIKSLVFVKDKRLFGCVANLKLARQIPSPPLHAKRATWTKYSKKIMRQSHRWFYPLFECVSSSLSLWDFKTQNKAELGSKWNAQRYNRHDFASYTLLLYSIQHCLRLLSIFNQSADQRLDSVKILFTFLRR